MSTSNRNGCLGVLTVLTPILIWLAAGYTAWNWIAPNSFIKALLFLIVWSVLGYLFQIVVVGIFAAINSKTRH